jgi:predicted transposase YbfD/YdcC
VISRSLWSKTKGFGSQLKTSAISYSQTVKTPQFNSINAIQDNLLSYIEDIQDPRVPRTQKHLFKDVLVIAILAVIAEALHLVTAWASEQRLLLGQLKVESHSNEITAIPALLELLDITGAIVTLDAMGTQYDIIQLIRDKKADYIVSLKGNHPTLFSQVQQWFKTNRANSFQGIKYDSDQRI